MMSEQHHVLSIIKNNVFYNPDALQCYSMNNEQILNVYKDILVNRKMLYEYEDGLLFLFQPFSNYMCQIHLFSTSQTQFVTNAKKLTSKLFSKHPFLKIFGITSNKRFIKVSHEKTGWKHEGTLTNSSLNREGQFQDQYILSAFKLDFLDDKSQ